MFGFQLSNIIPGFPKHMLYFVDPPYELQASQECENGQVSFQVNATVKHEYHIPEKNAIVIFNITCTAPVMYRRQQIQHISLCSL